MTLTLGAAALILTGVAVVIALIAWWGYRDIKKASVSAAETEARRIAENVANREIAAYMKVSDAANTDISAAYQDQIS